MAACQVIVLDGVGGRRPALAPAAEATMVQRLGDIHAYLDGALDEAERRRFEQMLELDPEAAAMVRQYRQQAEELRRLYEPVMNEPVPDRMLQFLRHLPSGESEPGSS